MCQVYANSVQKGLFHSVDIVQTVKSLRKVFQKIVFDEFLHDRIHIIYDCHQDTTTPSRGRHRMNYALSPCFLVRLTVLQVSVACVFNKNPTLKSSFLAKEGSQCPAGFFFNQNSCEPVPSGRCRCNELTSHRCSQ